MDNAIFPNKFKAALAAHQVQIGCWCALANPISTEVLGLAGFDWLVLDAEHAPNDVTTLIPQLMALKGSSSAQVVRVPTNEPIIIKRMLDIGFYNFLVPFVETAEQAARRRNEGGFPRHADDPMTALTPGFADPVLDVDTASPTGANTLYERLGFVVEGIKTIAFAGGEHEVWRMRKDRAARL